MALHACINGAVLPSSLVRINFNNDRNWHEYVVRITNWNGTLDWLRLDPLKDSKSGYQVQIDYVAFFPDENSARAFRTSTTRPSVLWDFNADNAMNSYMSGGAGRNLIDFTGGSDGVGNNYYTFTAKGNDPFVYIDTPADASALQWVKIRAKNLSSTAEMELFANPGGITGDHCVRFPIKARKDPKEEAVWNDYVIHIPTQSMKTTGKNESGWKGALRGLRLDPLQGSKNGDQILIDYIAFFPDEKSARAFRSSSVDSSFIGDVLDFWTELSQTGKNKGMVPSGTYYALYNGSETGTAYNYNNLTYINGSIDMELSGKSLGTTVVKRPYYTYKPVFTNEKNSIKVIVPDAYRNQFDLTKGIFASGKYASVSHANGEYTYVIAQDVPANKLYTLTAQLKNSSSIAQWTLPDNSEYYGDTFYLTSSALASDNVVKLTVLDIASLMGAADEAILLAPSVTYVSLTGKLVTSTVNLSTGREATDIIPVKDACVSIGNVSAWTDENGDFTLPAVYSVNGANIRYTVTYNGMTTLYQTKVPPAGAAKSEALNADLETVMAVKANAGLVRIDSFDERGVHFTGAYANQIGILVGTLKALAMNGKELTFRLKVDNNKEYEYDGETYVEHVKDVTVYFKNQYTGEVHGVFSSSDQPAPGSVARWAWDDFTGEFTLVINQFDPEHEEEWTYGDVLMAQITTDKKLSLWAFEGNDTMVYNPVSTGFGVYADPDYEPLVFDYDIDNIASMLQIEPKTDGDGKLLSDDDTRYSFGSFPYIGEITAMVGVFSKLFSSSTMAPEAKLMLRDLESMAGTHQSGDDGGFDDDDEDFYDPAEDGLSPDAKGTTSQQFKVSAFFKTDYTDYGGVRFMVGVIVTTGGGSGYYHQSNPYDQASASLSKGFSKLVNAFASPAAISNAGQSELFASPNLIHHQGNEAEQRKSEFGGPYFQFGVFFGFYLDYGYIEIAKADGTGGSTKSHDMVFMGAGGFLGFTGNVGYTWPFMIVFIPAYFNVEAGLDLTFFLGSSGDPQKTLDSFKNSSELHGQDFQFSFEFKGKIYVTGTIGIGFYKVLGVRVSASLGFEAGYSLRMPEWYPKLFNTGWGYVSEITLTGTIDLGITSIDIYSATWPLPLADGFMYYFQEARRGNLCISYVTSGISEGNGSASARATASNMAKELSKLIDSANASADEIKTKTYDLKDYAYDNGIISWLANSRIKMNKQGGIVGSAINASLQDAAVLQDADAPGAIRFHTNNHVNSQWVADNGQLMAAFSAVRSSPLVEDAYAQPSSKIMSIGQNRFLMVFLDDTPSRDKMQAATLKWTVYDANSDSWTDPQVVQNDATADGKPHLADAGGKLILSWSSMTDEKYDALKEAAADEIRARTGAEATDYLIQEALENDPARVMAAMDIFTVAFDKDSRAFGDIVQLTDDDFYDDNPQAVYDPNTGDYIVMYYKTAQDAEDYSSSGDKLLDMVGVSADPEKTYSVIAYMLYNNQTDTPDALGQTHEAGWATGYYFPNETEQSPEEQAQSLARFGGQRFLPSTLRSEDGGQLDPAIADLTVASNYNGIAAYAFTVDKDFNLNTAEDRELYVQFYDFASHSTYVPVKVAGSVTESRETYDSDSHSFVTLESVRQVEVGTPKLVRNGENTYLFWREDGYALKYLNISEMLNARVAAVAEPGESESDWTYAVRPDGSFAVDASTGLAYEPNVMSVNIASFMTEQKLEITEYEIITDADNNLYVVWTDTVTRNYTDEESGQTYPVAAQEIYASAMIYQEEETVTDTDEDGNETEGTTRTVRWSKPYRLTRNNAFNDGLALALDDDGGLIIVHNQYSRRIAESEEEMESLIKSGKIGLTQDQEGNYYAASLAYNTPVSLTVTRCDKVGSLEATAFAWSDEYPVAGETITVAAAIENVGLTDAKGCEIEFYEYKDGVRGRKIAEVQSDETIQVNTARRQLFRWTIPAEGVDGYSIEAVIREKNGSGYYEPVSSFSDAFKTAARFDLNISEIAQEGDQFRVDFDVKNSGNADAPEGSSVGIRLVGLYGRLDSDRYGNLESGELYTRDVASSLPAKTADTDENGLSGVESSVYEDSVLLDIPVSVFRYCGYDALQLVITDKDGNLIKESDQFSVKLETPVNLNLNDGEIIFLNSSETTVPGFSYDSTVFMQEPEVFYSVENPDVATVDENGVVTALASGVTNLTATLLPSGKSATVRLAVDSGPDGLVTVTFDTNGGSETESVTMLKNETVSEPTPPVKEGYNFDGWYLNGARYDFSRPVTENITLQARWKSTSSSGSKAGCYVATSVYGSYDCPEVWTLRRFRDEVLAETWYGRLFIRAYYAVSPTAVKLFGGCEWFQTFWRGQLDNLVEVLQSEGFASTPYEDVQW